MRCDSMVYVFENELLLTTCKDWDEAERLIKKLQKDGHGTMEARNFIQPRPPENIEYNCQPMPMPEFENGDYQQTKGSRSEKRIPTGKLFGLRKFDYIQTPKVTGFIKGKRSTGFFTISDLEGKVINPSVNVKKNCTRLTARTTTLIERRGTFLHEASPVVSCA